jgi:hypothetical protein
VDVSVRLGVGVIVLLKPGDIAGFVGVFGRGAVGEAADFALQAVRTTTNTSPWSRVFIPMKIFSLQHRTYKKNTSAEQAG